MSDIEKYLAKRAAVTIGCRDAEGIPKIPEAGAIINTPAGVRVQLMHNGIKVLADGYYASGISEIITAMRGHHEPQEEKVFHEVLKHVAPNSVMLELGAYWSYYSLWFNHAVPGAINYMVEPVADNLAIGKRNFELNKVTGTFIHALVGDHDDKESTPPMVSVDGLMAHYKLDNLEILHADIQKHEYAMLQGARKAFGEKRVRFAFVSTHGGMIHSRCLSFLRRHGYRILAEHTRYESYSADGLIVATIDTNTPAVPISHRPGVLIFLKSFLYRLIARFI
jgi:hypothetical protein